MFDRISSGKTENAHAPEQFHGKCKNRHVRSMTIQYHCFQKTQLLSHKSATSAASLLATSISQYILLTRTVCLYVYIVFRFLRLSVYYVTLSYKTQKKYAEHKANTQISATKICKTLRVNQHVRRTTAPCLCGVFCGGVVVFLYFCFLWWCSCGGVFVVAFLC